MKKVTFVNFPLERSFFFDQIEFLNQEFKLNLDLIELSPSESVNVVKKKIESSHLIVISGEPIFNYFENDFILFLRDWISKGGSALMFISTNIDQFQNQFLSNFGMTNTGIKLRAPYGYDVDFSRTPHSYRDRVIFKGVDKVTLTQPNRIYLDGEAQPLLYNNEESEYMAIEVRTDFLADLDDKYVSPIAIWENSYNKGRLITINGSFPFDKNKGFQFDSYNNDNAIFFSNIVHYLLDKPDLSVLAYEHFFKIEISLFEFIQNVMSRVYGTEWRNYIPENIKEKASEIAGNPLDFQYGLFFISLKKIIHSNWDVFKPYFQSLDLGGKSKSLAWIDKTNEVRNLVAHPLKGLKEDQQISKESIDILSSHLDFVKRLNEAFENNV